jgi:hypothetical protein
MIGVEDVCVFSCENELENNENNYDQCLEVVKDLERKAEQEREKYSALAIKSKKLINVFSAITILSSIAVAFLSIADPRLLDLEGKESFFIYLTLLGFVLTFVAIADRLLNLNQKHAAYHTSISMLTEYIRDSHAYRHTEMKSDRPADRIRHTESLKNTYSKIIRSLPKVDMSPEQFLRLKQIFSLKISASKKIDDNPMVDISPEIKKIRILQKRR